MDRKNREFRKKMVYLVDKRQIKVYNIINIINWHVNQLKIKGKQNAKVNNIRWIV